MGQERKLYIILLTGLLTVAGCSSTGSFDGQSVPTPPIDPSLLAVPGCAASPLSAQASVTPVPPVPQPDGRPLPISLPAALGLAHVRAIDIEAASARIQVAAANLEQAKVLWLPTVTFGSDYFRHDGIVQDFTSGEVLNDSHQGLVIGAGPMVNLDIGQAIFAPLVAHQQLAARQADLQAASNDTLLDVTDAYFNVQQARGQLAGAMETIRLTEDLVNTTRKLAPAIVPELETIRAEAELARQHQVERLGRERWRVASAELLRLLRLDPATQVEPLEPPQLQVELVALNRCLDELIPIALTNRPELASQQAQVQATLTLLRQEKLRPLIPSLLLRGFSTPVSGTLMGAYAMYGNNGSLTNSQFRDDIDIQVLWRLDNLGFGNVAAVHQRSAANRQAVVELFRIQDRVAAEVAQALAQLQEAVARLKWAERDAQLARESFDKNLAALRQTKGVGNQVVLLVRPQEVVAAVQALSQAYLDYYGAVADVNRAQFRLYRALGQPAQFLGQDHQPVKLCDPTPPSAPTPAQPGGEVLPAPRQVPAQTGGAGNPGLAP